MKLIRFWLNNSRPVSLPQSVIPALTAIFLGIGKEKFSVLLSVISLLGVIFAHLSMNLIDDYFDYKKMQSGFRDCMAREGVRARTEKCPYLTSGKATTKHLKIAIVVFAIPAIFAGLIVFYFRGLPILIIAIITAFLGISYSGNPLRLSYRGLGEPIIGLIFGPLLVVGISFASYDSVEIINIITGLAMGFLVTNILYTHSILDYEADKKAGKSTLAGLIKTDFGKLFASAIIIFFPFILFIIFIIFKLYSPLYLIVFLTLPWGINLFISLKTFLKSPYSSVKRSFWQGPMGHWKAICDLKLDWFMYRWYMARNMVTAFGLLIIIASVINYIIKL